MLKDITGITETSNELSKLSSKVKEMYNDSTNGSLINTEKTKQEIEELSQTVKGFSSDVSDARNEIANALANMGNDFGNLLANMNNLKNNSPTTEIANQLDSIKPKLESFITEYSKLTDLKLDINDSNFKTSMDSMKNSVNDLLNTIGNGNAAFDPMLQSLENVDRTLNNSGIVKVLNDAANAAGDLNRGLDTTSQLAQSSGLSINQLGKALNDVSTATNTLNNDFAKVFQMIAQPGNTSGLNDIAKQTADINNTLTTLQQNIKSVDTWKSGDGPGNQIDALNQQVQNLISGQSNIMQQMIAGATGTQLNKLIKDFESVKGALTDSVSQMVSVLNDDSFKINNNFDNVAQENAKKFKEQLVSIQENIIKEISTATIEANTLNAAHNNILGRYGGDNLSTSHAELMRIAHGSRLDESYSYDLNHMKYNSDRIHNSSRLLQRDVDNPNSSLTYNERFAMRNIDFGGIANESGELSRLQHELAQYKELYTKNYNIATSEKDPVKRQEAHEKAKGDFVKLQEVQQKIQGHAVSLGRAIKVSSPEDKARLSLEAKNLLRSVQTLVKEASESSDKMYLMGKNLGLSEADLSGLKKGTDQVQEMKKAMDDAEKSSHSLWNSMRSGIHDAFAPLRLAGRGLTMLGIGGLGGGIGGMFSQLSQVHTEQQRNIWDSMRTGVGYGQSGLDSNNLSMAENRINQGISMYRQTGGRIGMYELNNSYNSAMQDVGGGYGKSAGEGSADINQLVNSTFFLQKGANIDQGTMNQAYQTFYKDMGQSADDAVRSIHNLSATAQAANIPVGKYLRMVSDLAQQYMKIGLSGKDAENIMNNMIGQGMRADVAKDLASQTGGAVGKFADDNNQVAFAGSMMGMDPWEAIGMSYNSHDSKGNINKGWSQNIAKMMDTMTNVYAGVADGDPNIKRKVLGDQFRSMGYDRRTSSMLTNSFMEGNNNLFEKLLEEAEDKKSNPNAIMENELKTMTGLLSGQDVALAEIKAEIANHAKATGQRLDEIIKELLPTIIKFVGTMAKMTESIAGFVADLLKSPLFKNGILPMAENAVSSPGNLIGTLGGLYLGKKALTGKLKLPNWSTSAEARAAGRLGSTGTGIFGTLMRNPKTTAAALAGLTVAGFASKAFASPRWEGGDDHGVFGHIAGRLDDIVSIMSGEGINIKGGHGSGTNGTMQDIYAQQQMKDAMSFHGGESDAFGAGMVGLSAYSIGNAMSKRFISTDAYTPKLPHKLASKALGGLGKFGLTAVLSEAAMGAYDIYDHKQNGSYVDGDISKNMASSGVNLGYAGAGALLGSLLLPGVGTVGGAMIGSGVGMAVDAFGDKDANGKGVNDRAKDMLYSIISGGDTSADLENRRSSQIENNRYGFNGGSDKDKIKAKLELMGYSDKEAEEMSSNLEKNSDKLKELGIDVTKMSLVQKTALAEHMKKLGANAEVLNGNTKQSEQVCRDLKDLSSALKNSNFADKTKKNQEAREEANKNAHISELQNKGVLASHLDNKYADLSKWREKLVADLQGGDLSKSSEIEDVDEKMEKIRRAHNTLRNSDEDRRAGHKASYNNLSWWERGGQNEEEFVNNQMALDQKNVDDVRELWANDYASSRVGQDNSELYNMANPGSSEEGGSGSDGMGTNGNDELRQKKSDESRQNAANTSADKIVKQGIKQEELGKQGNKLTHDFMEQEKMLLKALELNDNHNTKQVFDKLESIRQLLDVIRYNTANMGRGGAGGKGAAGVDIRKDSGITGAQLNSKLGGALSGMGDEIAKQARAAGIDPAVLASIMMHESGNGSSAAAKEYNNFGGIMGSNGLKQFGSKEEGIAAVVATLKGFMKENKFTLGEIQKEYAPTGAANDPNNLNSNWLSGIGSFLQGYGYQLPTGGGGSSDYLNKQYLDHNHNWGSQNITDTDNLRAESKFGANLLGEAVYKATGEKMMITGGAEKGIHSISSQGIGHEDGWKMDTYNDSTRPGTPGGDALVKAAHDAGYSIVWENDHWDINFSGQDSRDRQSSGGNYTHSMGTSYQGGDPMGEATARLENQAYQNVTNATNNNANTNDPAKSGTMSEANFIGSVANANSNRALTGKAFQDYSMIYHRLGDYSAYSGNVGSQGTPLGLTGIVSEMGGKFSGQSHREVMAKSRQMRLAFDNMQGHGNDGSYLAGNNPIGSSSHTYGISKYGDGNLAGGIGADLLKQQAKKNDEISSVIPKITELIENKKLDPVSASGDDDKQIAININAAGDLAEKLTPIILSELQKLGYSVKNVESTAKQAGRAAIRSLENLETTAAKNIRNTFN